MSRIIIHASKYTDLKEQKDTKQNQDFLRQSLATFIRDSIRRVQNTNIEFIHQTIRNSIA